MTVFLTKTYDTVLPRLEAMNATPEMRTRFFQAMGKRMEVMLRAFFKGKQSQGNKKGWASRGFWFGTSGVAQHTTLTKADAESAVVTIDDLRLAHKVRGGTVTPKRAKMIAIPLNEEAYLGGDKGRIRDVFPDLQVIVTAKGPWLVRSSFQQRSGGISGQRLEFMFRLVPSVTHAPDETAVPASSRLGDDLLPHAMAWLDRHVKG